MLLAPPQKRAMPHREVLSTNRVDRRHPLLRKIYSSLLEKILTIMQRVVVQARRAKALRAFVSRRPCTNKKEDTRRDAGCRVCSSHSVEEYDKFKLAIPSPARDDR